MGLILTVNFEERAESLLFGRPSPEGQLARPAGLEPATLGLEVPLMGYSQNPYHSWLSLIQHSFEAVCQFMQDATEMQHSPPDDTPKVAILLQSFLRQISQSGGDN